MIIRMFMPLVCIAMAWRSAHTGLRPVLMYLCKWMEVVAASWQEGTFMFILEIDEQNLPLTVSLTCCWHERPFVPVFHDTPFCRMNIRGWWQGLQKSALLSIFTMRLTKLHSQDVLCVIPHVCGEYFCIPRWNGREVNFPLSMQIRRYCGCHRLKNGACRCCSSNCKKTFCMSEVASTFAQYC